MKWIIKNPAPSDSRRHKWGDFHFGRSLTTHLERLGHQVVTHYDPDWDVEEDADVVLLLRGKYPFPPGTHRGALRVMWNISHPADVSLEEYATHDVVCVASNPLAERLCSSLDVPVHPLLQCTDTEEFVLPEDDDNRRGVVFIGNSRDVARPGVLWALEYGLPVKIWGRGWDPFNVPAETMQGDYFPNEDLGQLYAQSRVTLNDHWEDMRTFGFVNNRVFDALACGLPVISDFHEELVKLVPRGVLTHRDAREFERCVESVLLDYPVVLQAAREASTLVRERFSFTTRAQELNDIVSATMATSGG